MSTTKELKEYLINGDDGFLLNPDNNGKTIMLSGAWGSGKTHFWLNEIEPVLSEKLKANNKACIYVSLYGKDNIESIKNEILFKAYESIKEENKLAKRAISAFGFGSRLLSVSAYGVRANIGAMGDVVEGFFEGKKIDESESFLVDGGLICFDDFERKSKHIDLNDLFGFIAQLALDMNCKIVIILNSDVFEGVEKKVFKAVKEKTVNKFFYFKPEIEELFRTIYDSHEKYKRLDSYKEEILKAIKETEELNARIYIQILDNCLEWVEKEYNDGVLRTLVLNTICFIKNHFILSYYKLSAIREPNTDYNNQCVNYDEINYSSDINSFFINRFVYKDLDSKIVVQQKISSFFSDIRKYVSGETSQAIKARITTPIQNILLKEIDDNYNEMRNILKFGYQLFVARDIEKNIYEDISNFIKTGILPKQTKEVETSVPPEAMAETKA